MRSDSEQQQRQWRWRQRLAMVIFWVSLVTSFLAVALHYLVSRALVLETAQQRYQLTTSATRDYLSQIDHQATQTVRILARHPNLMQQQWIQPETPALFAEVMLNNPVLYAIYIGFPNGDFYELVNLDASAAVRQQLHAGPADRWVEITVRGEGNQRQRRFTYLDDQLQVKYLRSEPSDYRANQRLWFTRASRQEVYKTEPYLFQHLQAAGQSYALQIPGQQVPPGGKAVLTVDVTFSTLSDQLRSQPLSLDGDLYLFQRSGEVLADNHPQSQTPPLPVVAPLPLNAAQQDYVSRQGKIRIANETDWAPIDYTVAGEPRGFSVDLLRLLLPMAGLEPEFINGYRWPELVSLFQQGELDILQPVIGSGDNVTTGLLTRAWLTLQYALVTRADAPLVNSLSELGERVLVMPEGWSVNPVLRQLYPDLRLQTADSTRTALEQVQAGLAYATLDSEAILRRSAGQYFLRGLAFHSGVEGLQHLPASLHFQVHDGRLQQLLNDAINAVPVTVWQELERRWLQSGPRPDDQLGVVPYPELLEIAAAGYGQVALQREIGGREHYVFISPMKNSSGRDEYFAFVVSGQRLFAALQANVRQSALIVGGIWLLLMPLILLLLLRPLRRPR